MNGDCTQTLAASGAVCTSSTQNQVILIFHIEKGDDFRALCFPEEPPAIGNDRGGKFFLL